MTNEIPVSIYLFMLAGQFLMLLYALAIFGRHEERIDHIITASLSAILGWLNANLALNGNVNIIQSDGTTYSYIPVQSLPLHYFLLAVAIVSMIIVFWFVLDHFRQKVEEEQVFTALGGNL